MAHGDTPPPLRHANVLNGWSLRKKPLGMQTLMDLMTTNTLFVQSTDMIAHSMLYNWSVLATSLGWVKMTNCLKQVKLHKKILLCPINRGTHWTIEISWNEYSALGNNGNLKKKILGPFWSYQLNSTANSAYSPQKWAKWTELAVLFS